MNRTFVSFSITELSETKLQMLNWADRFNICCFLDNNQYHSGYNNVECLLGAGELYSLRAMSGTAFDQLSAFSKQHNDWLFGHLGFDLKNETEQLSSSLEDRVGFDDLFFFVPEFVIELTGTHMRIGCVTDQHQEIFQQIIGESAAGPQNTAVADVSSDCNRTAGAGAISIQQRYSRDEYLDTIRELQKHILRGDCYEINFCQEFYAEEVSLDPLQTFLKLTDASPNPFSAYYRNNHQYLMCASPERYLQKKGSHVISQPIKGTLKRSVGTADIALMPDDERNSRLLFESAKDRSENVMVVDLVRNDLSRICTEGSVKVDELFGVYTFPQVYQMISTISGDVRSDIDWLGILRVTFPMGSMTGAPKRRVLELIEKYERSKRGLFSGAVGYISPGRDFDFNVVIRSLLYNGQTGYLSFPAGSGITFYSDPELEYEECLVKAAAIRTLLENGCL